jgi:DNA-binding response OmpR family regulator
MYKVLVVEDNPSFGYILKEYLELNDLEVRLVTDGEMAIELMKKVDFDICLLDIMLPKKDGFSVAKEIQQNNSDLPFIFLTAKALKVDKLKGFRLGCDDYIVKPIDEELLLARIYAIIKRSNRHHTLKEEELHLEIGKFHFDAANQQLIHENNRQFLTDKEAQLLQLFCEHKNQLLSRKKALRQIWGNNDEFNRKSMDVFIFRLRKYLEADRQIRIKNIHGKGFILEEIA